MMKALSSGLTTWNQPGWFSELLKSFRRALLAAGTDRPHIITLDNVDRMPTEAFGDDLYPGLIRPIRRGDQGPQ